MEMCRGIQQLPYDIHKKVIIKFFWLLISAECFYLMVKIVFADATFTSAYQE